MIYSVYWAGLNRTFTYMPLQTSMVNEYRNLSEYAYAVRLSDRKIPRATYDGRKLFADVIKEGVGNSFLIILTPEQEESFRKFIAEYKLEENILYQMQKYTKNGNYWNQAPRLKLVYLSNLDHPMLDMFNDEESEETNED